MAGIIRRQWRKMATGAVQETIDANGTWELVDAIDSRQATEIVYRRADPGTADPSGTVVTPSYRNREGDTPIAIAGAASTLALAAATTQQACPIRIATPWTLCLVVTNYQNPFRAAVGQ